MKEGSFVLTLKIQINERKIKQNENSLTAIKTDFCMMKNEQDPDISVKIISLSAFIRVKGLDPYKGTLFDPGSLSMKTRRPRKERANNDR